MTKFKDCLTADVVVSAPMARSSPDNSWVAVHDKKIIPASLYKFYVVADYFSFVKCPTFLVDDQKIIFSHLSASVDLIKSSFEDYHDLLDLMKKYDADTYNPIKKIKKESFDPDAPKFFSRCLQLLFINMYSVLDATAEGMSAVLLWGKFGRASFAEIVKKVQDELIKTSIDPGKKAIVSPEEKYQEDIIKTIKKEILDDGNNEWFDLFKLYRDKMAHFRYYSGFLLHDNEGKFYHFLTRQWPYYCQQGITFGKTKDIDNKYFEDLLMECDIFEYCEGLHKKIYDLTEMIFQSLSEAYNIKKVSACNPDPDLRAKVEALTRKYKFKHFLKNKVKEPE